MRCYLLGKIDTRPVSFVPQLLLHDRYSLFPFSFILPLLSAMTRTGEDGHLLFSHILFS